MFGFTSNYVKVKTKYNEDLINQVKQVNLKEIDRDGLFLIDFEKACIDGVADNHKLHKRLHKLRLKGGLTALIVNWETMLLTVRA